VARDLLREQIEADGIVADHGFGHRRHTIGQRRQQLIDADEQLVMIGAEVPRDQIRILEFIAFFLIHRFKADGEGVQAALARLRQ
jgi:hypothetical protein